MNNFQLMGNLVKDPETKPASGNGSFTTFCIAVNDGFGEKKKTYFLECAAGGKAGENIAKFFHKGKQIIVEGKLYTAENRKSGFQEIRLQVWKFHFTSDGNQGGGNGGGNNNSRNNNQNQGGYSSNYNGGSDNNQNNGGNSNGGYNNQNNNNQNNQNQGGGDGPVDDIPF